MTKLELTNSNQFALIDSEDILKVSISNWYLFYKKSNKRKPYVRSTGKIGGRQVSLHRYILGITDPAIQTDHINNDPLDNRKSNLRTCTVAENNRNKSSHKNSTSQYLGVCYDRHRNKWAVCVCYNRKKVYRKRFNTEIEAALAYNKAAKKYFGEYANLNKVEV